MSNVIKDGHGSGHVAKVDDHGRLSTAANVISHMQHHATTHKNLFILNFNTTLSDSSETPVAFFKNNDGNKDFEFYHVIISSDANVQAKWRFGDEYTSGSETVTGINTNRGSGATLSSVDIYEGGAGDDLVLDSSNGVMFTKNWITGNQVIPFDFNGALIMPSNTSASMLVTGVLNQEVNLTVFVASHSAGTEL